MSEKVKPETKVEETKQASFVDELKKSGSVVLTSKSREELSKMVNNIPADVKYGAGAIGYDHVNRNYCLLINLVKK